MPPAPATACVIWLHGLGADGHDFEPVVPELGLGDTHDIRFVFPHAPARAVTVNGGMRMPAWYDIAGTDLAARQDRAGIEASASQIEALIERERNAGVAAERIVLAGFSQGGAIALHTGLRHARRLAGLIALSTYLPVAEGLADEAHAANRDIPIFMAHGRDDPIVPLALAQASRKHLEATGYRVDWHEYPMAHQLCLPEIATIGRWLRERLAA